MAKEMTWVVLSIDKVNEVWGLYYRLSKNGRHLAISNATGLPLATVKSVLFGQYEISNGVAIVTVPAGADRVVECREGVIAGRLRGV